jgi:hypothetical protein
MTKFGINTAGQNQSFTNCLCLTFIDDIFSSSNDSLTHFFGMKQELFGQVVLI